MVRMGAFYGPCDTDDPNLRLTTPLKHAAPSRLLRTIHPEINETGAHTRTQAEGAQCTFREGLLSLLRAFGAVCDRVNWGLVGLTKV